MILYICLFASQAFIPTSGHGIQGATVNCLGQEFAKAFEINFQDETGKKRMVWQNSWSYSTRTVTFLFFFAPVKYFFSLNM